MQACEEEKIIGGVDLILSDKKIKLFVRLTCAVLSVLTALAVFAPVSVSADYEKPELSSAKIAAMNVETGQFIINTAPGEKLQPGDTVKMMTALVAYEHISNLAALIKAPSKVNDPKYVGYGGISAPTLGIKAGSEYPAKAYLQALLVAEANDAAITLADYAAEGDIDLFVEWMNKKASSLGAKDTYFTNCTGVQDEDAQTTLRDVSIISAELFRKKDLCDLVNVDVATNEIGRFHTKNYLNSDYLVRDYVMKNALGLCAGQYTETSGYSLVAAESNGLSFTFVIMDAKPERREVETGKRWFDDGNAYTDMKLLVPWAVNGFKYVRILSRESFVREIPVKFSMKSDHVVVVPENDVECLLPNSIDPEKDIQLVEKWDVESLNAPVEKGMVVGNITIMQNGTEVTKIRLVTDSSLDASTLLTIADKFSLFFKNKYTKIVIRVVLILLIVYAALSLSMFIFRIARKYVRGAKDNDMSIYDEAPENQKDSKDEDEPKNQ